MFTACTISCRAVIDADVEKAVGDAGGLLHQFEHILPDILGKHGNIAENADLGVQLVHLFALSAEKTAEEIEQFVELFLRAG